MKAVKRNIGQEMIAALSEVRDVLKSGAPLAAHFDVRHVEVPEPSRYGPKQVRQIRLKLRVSQPVFAELLGVSPMLEKHVEQGGVNPIQWLADSWMKSNAIPVTGPPCCIHAVRRKQFLFIIQPSLFGNR